MTITEMLDQLAEMRSAIDLYRLSWEQKRTEIMAPVAKELADLDAEYEPLVQTAREKADALEMQVREVVLANGASVKGARLQAVWMKGRVSWDTKKLDGLMIALPQLKECRTEGAPSVSIRSVGG